MTHLILDTRHFSFILALCFAYAFSVGGLRAQTYTPVQYNFSISPQSVAGGSAVNAMAANGYGLWLSGPYGSFSYAWMLEGNGITNGPLAVATDDHGLTHCVQSTKVATNLLGSVRYVSINDVGNGFIVSGLNDGQLTGPTGSNQISINIPYSSNPNILSDPSRAAVETGGEYVYPSVSTSVTGEPQYSPQLEPISSGGCNYTDLDWDVAMDGNYLYIVWYHNENSFIDNCWQGDEIFLTCVKLADGSVPAGFPIKLHTRICAGDNQGIGCGIQPTVACDVRNNTSADVNGLFHPACEIAYIDDFGAVNHLSILNTAITVAEKIPTNVLVPWDPTDVSNGNKPYKSVALPIPVLRARIMVASAGSASSGSGMQNHVIGYYVVTGTSGGTSLYFFHETDGVFFPGSGTSYGWYVDGPSDPPNTLFPQEAQPIGGYGQLVEWSPGTQIVGFANPYDGQSNGNYDEFHCVYATNKGLMIVRGADNGMPWPTTPIPYLNDTRTVVNQSNHVLMAYPDGFCSAVNQAGIHILWDDASNENYARDRRSYDEPIEEQTIMSYDNYISDGSGHLGTLGSQTKPGKFVLVEYNGTINFGNPTTPATNANAAGLTIGTTSGADALAKLIIYPNFGCTFQSPPLTTNRNFIQIDRSGTCDFYGGTLTAGGDFNLNGNGTGLVLGAPLNIMPGCNFNMVNDGTIGFPRLTSIHATIVAKTGTGLDHSPLDNGTITVNGAIQCDNSTLTCSALPTSPTLVYLINLYGVANCPFGSYIRYSTIADAASGGQELVNFYDPLNTIDFDHTTFSGVGISGYFADHESDNPIPSRPLSIGNCSFDNILYQGIHLKGASENVKASYSIGIDDNDFRKYIGIGADGILLEDFDINIPGDLADFPSPIYILSNTFTTANTTFDTSHVEAAIHLRNTSAVVDGNTIDGERSNGTSTYAYGIWQNESSNPDNTSIANTLLCSNIISYVGYAPSAGLETGGGIATSSWQGYEKMNDISHSAQGSIFGSKDAGNYLVDDIHDNNGPGINNTADHITVTNGIEMRGLIHPDNVGDMGGYNIVKNNNLDHNSSSGEIVISNGVKLHVGNENGTGSGSVTYGENALIENATTDKLIFGPTGTGFSCVIGSDGSTPDNCLNANYYQRGTGGAYVPSGTNPETEFGGNVSYNSTTGTVSALTLIPANPGIECYSSGGGELSKRDGVHSASSQADTLSSYQCDYLSNRETLIRDGGDYQKAYDTAKLYLTLCYNQHYSEGMFSNASADVDAIAHAYNAGDTTVYDIFREWLKSVLYLRMDSSWYCADVFEIVHTFMHYPGHGHYLNAMEAITRYILENNRCDSEWSGLFKEGIHWPSAIQDWWSDTVRDSLTEPRPDTTVPSIDSIGLSILSGPQAGVEPSPIAPGQSQFSGLYVTENPFTNTTAIKFTLADYGLVTFQLFDVLGHAVTTNGIGQVLYPGAHEFDIDGSKLAPGNYIARVAFHDGDVQSIMVVKK